MSCEGCPNQGSCGKDQSSCQIENNPNNHIKKIVAVMSGKGGVGKSTITVMLAKSLAKKGLKVGIMDADITGPSIPRLFAAEHEQAYATKENFIIPIETADHIKIMSLNFMMKNESDPVIWRGPIIAGVVKQFYTDVIWGDLDVLLIDMPPGTGDVALTIMQSLPVSGVVMVSTPQPMVSMIVSKAIHMCHQMSIAVYGVIENMAYLECPNCQEKIDFYEKSDLDSFIRENETKIYCTLPMLDLIRDINQYAEYNDNQKEIIESLISDTACSLCDDLHLECHK
ncbi:Mrp family chromosome partitioning ATPase [Faecalicoccus acidiformans]|uniref:Iron-sulfur cluster carrier protein n=1 Tax=Faecalicoccus acidiformans TaxID=915173 RepID=A0A7W8FZT2_9FIRM|nr:Mrp/NBP35 family ATP-binding protein [Faecalicoccus acidiformans]MBB5185332.1 Mrp family chromosome partitioning ATPase [Faecalicoccus acidiformans]MBM6830912.1 Mrp/NBP35 family ATP-binding protein [Faecalicoccus acidiformans]MDM8203896.1 Mrp/NBP35 family ATP-binding protein [Faecalicoccus acidiformans]